MDLLVMTQKDHDLQGDRENGWAATIIVGCKVDD